MDSPGIEIAVTLSLFVAMIIAIEFGYRFGHRRKLDSTETTIEVIGTVDAAVFGLLGLILAFTFSGAADRLVIRRAQIVQEANAIGTAYLRVDLLPAAEQPAIRQFFRDYLEARIEVFDKFLDHSASDRALRRGEQLQQEIWSHSVSACRAEPRTDACLLVVPALNDMIDITTTRTMAARTHAPGVILALLVILALVAGTLSGFAMSRQARRSMLHVFFFSLVISSSIYVVLDLEYPRAGLINLRSTDTALEQLRDTMK
jgi:hypothetical protein